MYRVNAKRSQEKNERNACTQLRTKATYSHRARKKSRTHAADSSRLSSSASFARWRTRLRQIERRLKRGRAPRILPGIPRSIMKSEEHTSELQSLRHLVCRLLLEKKTIR